MKKIVPWMLSATSPVWTSYCLLQAAYVLIQVNELCVYQILSTLVQSLSQFLSNKLSYKCTTLYFKIVWVKGDSLIINSQINNFGLSSTAASGWLLLILNTQELCVRSLFLFYRHKLHIAICNYPYKYLSARPHSFGHKSTPFTSSSHMTLC